MKSTAPVTLAGSPIDVPCHACAFFQSDEEEYRVLLPFLQEGIDQGHRSFHITDRRRQTPHRERLSRLVNVPEAEGRRQLEVQPWEKVHLIDGYFDQHRMLDTIQEVLRDGRQAGYPMTRFWANMEWALEDVPNVRDLVEYESRLNQVLPQYDDVVVCTYDLRRFSAAVVVDIMRVHPVVIVGGAIHRNPFFTPPDQFLKELSTRSGALREARSGAA